MTKSLKIPKEVIRSSKQKDTRYNGQKFEDTKEVIRSSKQKDRRYNDQKFEDIKEVIRSSKQKDRRYNDQKKKDKTTNYTENQILSNANPIKNLG